MQIPVKVKIKLTDVGKKKVAEDMAAIMLAVHETAAVFPETVTDPDFVQILQQVDLAAIELHLSMANSAVTHDSLCRAFLATYYEEQTGKLIVAFKPMLCFRGADLSKINAYRLFKDGLCGYLREWYRQADFGPDNIFSKAKFAEDIWIDNYCKCKKIGMTDPHEWFQVTVLLRADLPPDYYTMEKAN